MNDRKFRLFQKIRQDIEDGFDQYVVGITSEIDLANATMPLCCHVGQGENPILAGGVAFFKTEGEAKAWVDRGEEFDGDLFDWAIIGVPGRVSKND